MIVFPAFGVLSAVQGAAFGERMERREVRGDWPVQLLDFSAAERSPSTVRHSERIHVRADHRHR